MGRAIDQDNKLDSHDSRLNDYERRLKLVEDALEEMVQTRVHHVDLHSEEEFTPPAGKRKKTTKRKTAVIEKSSAEA
jgi:hypothetical protein